MRLGASACFRRYIAGGARPNVGATSKPTRNALQRTGGLAYVTGAAAPAVTTNALAVQFCPQSAMGGPALGRRCNAKRSLTH